jgi:MFS superfamily sulfate permease-like transporter
MGISTAVFGGFFGSMFGGSDFNVQGPTGSLSPILAFYAVSYGQGVLPWMAIGAGMSMVINTTFLQPNSPPCICSAVHLF